MVKRISFDRPQHTEITDTTQQIIRDKERILEGWERVYTVISVVDVTSTPSKIRFGTGGEDSPKWHEEEQNPAANVYYHTEREYHCRRHDRGLVAILGGTEGDTIIVNWHGYDKKLGE